MDARLTLAPFLDGKEAADHVRYLATKVPDADIAGVLLGCADVMDALQAQVDQLNRQLSEQMEMGEYDG